MLGKLIIISAPSGAGKTSIVRYLISVIPHLEFSVSACTRKRRPEEVHGKDYYFLSVDEFKEKIKNNEFVEWEEVYEGSYYGTLRGEVERIWAKGSHVIFDVDVRGGLNLKKAYGDKALGVFIMPPSIGHLEARLRMRETEDDDSLTKRVGKATVELTTSSQFDFIVINDTLEHAQKEAELLVKNFFGVNLSTA